MGQGKGPGSYLAKSGSVYIFQIKMPKASGGTRDIPPLRLSLGACSHRRARLLADLLAAKARLMFDPMRFGRGMQEDDPAHSEMQALEKIIEMKGELKAYLRMIEGPEAPIAAEELRKQARGEPFNELIVGHAEMLKQSAIAKLSNSSALMDPKPNVAVNLTPAPLVKTSQPDVHQTLVAEPPAWSGPDRPRDAEGKLIPAFELDRRSVKRPQSSQLRLRGTKSL
ncbi:hypothetical protein LZK73_31005 (plasmid) [Neorhizobium galegae]|nr:hypothetical protein LZK73_31005 [Neorhizobium galegae]